MRHAKYFCDAVTSSNKQCINIIGSFANLYKTFDVSLYLRITWLHNTHGRTKKLKTRLCTNQTVHAQSDHRIPRLYYRNANNTHLNNLFAIGYRVGSPYLLFLNARINNSKKEATYLIYSNQYLINFIRYFILYLRYLI